MNRKDFLKKLTILPVAATAMKSEITGQLAGLFENTDTMPVLFVGHGNPMNAIVDNDFVKGWRTMATELPRPNAILCISAHWETSGTFVTAMPKPPTIHDFGGFPQALFDVQYPAPGSPQLAEETKNTVTSTPVGLDQRWGLDHGCWSVLLQMFPDADIPVIQMSLDYNKPPQAHYELAKELAALRRKGVLIIGSGNMVHNLGMVAWDKGTDKAFAYDWALDANDTLKELIAAGNHKELFRYESLGKELQLAVPSPDHYLPMLYPLSLQEKNEQVSFFNDTTVMGSISMTSFKIS